MSWHRGEGRPNERLLLINLQLLAGAVQTCLTSPCGVFTLIFGQQIRTLICILSLFMGFVTENLSILLYLENLVYLEIALTSATTIRQQLRLCCDGQPNHYILFVLHFLFSFSNDSRSFDFK